MKNNCLAKYEFKKELYFRAVEKIKTFFLNGTTIYLMEISSMNLTEYMSALTPEECFKLNIISNLQKKIEFSASRFLKHFLFGENNIAYTESKSPYIIGEKKFISISHSRNFVAIGTNNDFEIGIDVEEIDSKAARLSSKFITEHERTLFDEHSNADMTLLWSFKETLYKLSDRRQLIFQKDILVSKNGDNYVGSVQKTDGVYEYDLSKLLHQNIFITCNTSKGILKP